MSTEKCNDLEVAGKKQQKPQQYHHGNLRQALIEASLKLIQERGVRSLTLREIGSTVGVSRMAPYRHFEDKADLLRAISEAGFSMFADALEAAKAAAPADFPSQLSAMALAYVRFALRHQSYYEVMFGSPPEVLNLKQEPEGSAARAFNILLQTVIDGQQSGELRQDDALLLARAVWSLVHGISTLRLETDMRENGAGTKFVLFCAEVMKTGLVRT